MLITSSARGSEVLISVAGADAPVESAVIVVNLIE